MTRIDLQVLIEIAEVDASQSITPDRWDDAGNKIDDMPAEEFEALLASMKGKSRFDISLHCNGMRRNLRSSVFTADERDIALQNSLMAARHVLGKQIIALSIRKPVKWTLAEPLPMEIEHL